MVMGVHCTSGKERRFMDQHPVLQTIIHRCRTGSVPGHRLDGLKVGLAIESGAMSGVVSAGMLAALEYIGLLPAFDVVYGSSAGAINGAYFLAGQAASGAALYYENINNSRFLNPLRLLCGAPPISLNFLFERAMIRGKPLNWRKVVQSPIELVPLGTSVKTGETVLLRGAQSRENLFLRLKASAQFPFPASSPIRVAEEEFFEGGLNAPIPVGPALEEGCTHVLALVTQPIGASRAIDSFLDRYFVSKRLAKYNPLLRTAFLSRVDSHARNLNWLEDSTGAPARSPYVCAIRPPRGAPFVSRFENRWKQLVSGARSGAEAVLEAFGQPRASWPWVLLPSWVTFFRAMNCESPEHFVATAPNSPEMVRQRAG
jgi:predicted patatin/cPLA2 family phospholipase